MRHLAALALTIAAGCTPNLPFVVAETAEVLRKDEVRVTGAVGTGGWSNFCKCGGGGLRVRLGIGERQEVGIEGAMAVDSEGTIFHGGGKLSWKLGVADWLALVVGVGIGHDPGSNNYRSGPVYGFDGMLLASTALGRLVALYAGVRGSVELPFNRDLRDDAGTGVNAVLPLGIAIGDPRYRFYIEAGYIHRWHFEYGAGIREFGPREKSYDVLYGAVGFGWVFGRRSTAW